MQVPDTMVAELIEGELYAWPRPSGRHAKATSVLGMIIGSAYQLGQNGPGDWLIIDEPELHLPTGDVLVPDLAGWRQSRMTDVPDDHKFTVTPDWICEALSGSTERIVRVKKMPAYARSGIRHAWIVEVDQQFVEIKRLVNGAWTDIGVFAGDDVVRAEPFELVEISLARLWRVS